MPNGGPPVPPSGAEAWAGYVEDLLAGQDERKASIEQRGLAVLTSSGTLVTLLFGLVALIAGADGFELPKQARGPMAGALILFVIAALVGLLTNLPQAYKNVDPAALDEASLDRYWGEPADDAMRRITATRVKALTRAMELNGYKANALWAAMLIEVFAVIFVAVSVGEILKHG